MHCKIVRALYTVFQEGDINEVRKKKVIEHIKKCDSCRKLYESLDKITSLAGTYKNFKPEKDTIEQILERIKTVPRTRSFLEPRWVIAYTTIFIIIAAASFGIFRRMNAKKQLVALTKQEELFKRKGKYIMDYGQFEKGNVIYTIPGEGYSVKVIETSY